VYISENCKGGLVPLVSKVRGHFQKLSWVNKDLNDSKIENRTDDGYKALKGSTVTFATISLTCLVKAIYKHYLLVLHIEEKSPEVNRD
jgi:hypothetical protein